MIDYFVNSIAAKTVSQGIVSKEDEPILRYGLQAMAEVTIILITVLLISAAFGMMTEAMVWMGTVILCRSFGGGYHAKTFKQCYVVSATIFTLTLLTVKMMHSYFLPLGIISIAASAILLLYLRSAKRDPEGGNEEESSRFGGILKAVYACFAGFMLFSLLVWGMNSYVITGLLGFLAYLLSVLIQNQRRG
ncbi:accessory gene regulator B family protein [Paenibacillus sp. M1]|uniref:Accessory gene regulator B family protein n=1 Tax=Paenibacillus haidiansis TaxID=1574488 RepID=A0ABU7VR86_9BACL